MQKRWILPRPAPPQVDEALASFPEPIRGVLFQRGIEDRDQADAFLAPAAIASGDPFRMRGMAAAVERILRAVREGEQIAVYGDYDADGVSGTALLVGALEEIGARARHYIPHRFDEGYGLHNEALSTLHAEGIKLVVSVDCGVRSLREAAHAQSLGLDLIITDHHPPGPSLPAALAVVNPRQDGDPYEFKGLAGVGIAFKLAQALLTTSGRRGPERMLDLVAIGTVADLAPLKHENRELVREGLRRLNQAGAAGYDGRPGIAALREVAGIPPGRITSTAIAFALAPRLNAAGRLDSAEKAYRLLASRDMDEAKAIAGELNAANRLRQEQTRETVDRIRARVDSAQAPSLVAEWDPGFSIGIAGLVASRLTEEYYRPAVVAQQMEETTRASARSIPEFPILEALESCADLLLEFGGHAAAAGFTVRTSDFEALRERLTTMAGAALEGKDLAPRLQIDAVVELPQLGLSLLEWLDAIEPCGFGNPTPVFAVRDARVLQAKTVGAEGSHLKLTLSQGRRSFDAIAFRRGDMAGALPRQVDAAFSVERNLYLGRETLELNVQDIRPAGEGGWFEK